SWDADEAVKNAEKNYTLKRNEIAKYMGFTAEESVIVDGWVRQWLYQSLAEDGAAGKITYTDAMKALGAIEANVRNHRLPTNGGMVPRIHYEDLKLIFDRATSGRSQFTLQSSKGNTFVAFD